MLRPAARRVHQVGAVELGAGDGERGRDPGEPVRPVGHLAVAPLGPDRLAEAPGHEGPVGPGLGRLPLRQQEVGGAVGQRGRARGAVPVGPEGPEEVARRAEGDVVDAGVRGEPRGRHPRLVPAVVGGELGEPGDRLLGPVGAERRQHAEVADEAVEVGVRRRSSASPRRTGSTIPSASACSSRSTPGSRGPPPARARARRCRCASRRAPRAGLRRVARSQGSMARRPTAPGPAPSARPPHRGRRTCRARSSGRSSPFIPGRAARRPSPTAGWARARPPALPAGSSPSPAGCPTRGSR